MIGLGGLLNCQHFNLERKQLLGGGGLNDFFCNFCNDMSDKKSAKIVILINFITDFSSEKIKCILHFWFNNYKENILSLCLMIIRCI